MKHKTHLAFCFLISLFFADFFINKWAFIGVALFFTLLPDIDSATSKFGRKTRPVSDVIEFFGHRGIFHSVYPLVGLLYLYFQFNSWVWLAAFLGYSSHLIMDMFTSSGIKWLYPFSGYHVKGFIRTGSIFEFIFFLFLVFLIFNVFLGKTF